MAWILLLLGGSLHAQSRYSFDFTSTSLEQALTEIATTSGHRLFYSASKVDLSPEISYQCQDKALKKILDDLLKPRNIQYAFKGKQLFLQAAENQTKLKVQILDPEEGDPIPGVVLYLRELGQGRITDHQGRATFNSIPQGEWTVEVQSMGWADTSLSLILVYPEQSLQLSLRSIPLELGEVIELHDNLLDRLAPSTSRLPGEAVRANQSVNEDPLALVRLQPGVAAVNGLYTFSGLHIRGGEPTENLTLLDNIRLPFPTFLNGRSLVNPAFIKEIELLTGGFAARYGNHMSAVQNFQTRSGDMHRWQGGFRQSFWNSQAEVEGPLIKDKLSILGIARKSTTDWLLRDPDELIPGTLDLNLKLEAYLSPQHRLSFTQLYARELITTDSPDSMEPFQARANILSNSLQWQYLPTEKLFSKLSLLGGFNRWEIDDVPPLFARSRQSQVELREDLRWEFHPRHQLKLGGALEWERIRGGILQYYEANDHGISDSSLLLLDEPLDANVLRSNAYATLLGQPKPWFHYQVGLRLDQHLKYGWTQLSPRLGLEFLPFSKWKLQLNAGRFTQNPAPHIVALAPDIGPSEAHHYSVGIQGTLGAHWIVSVETYRKEYRRLIRRDLSQAYGNQGEGYAQGLELEAAANFGRWRFASNYTLSYAQRQRHYQIQAYPFFFDQRHMANSWMTYKTLAVKGWVPDLIQLDFRYGSGRPFTPARIFVSPTGHRLISYGEINSGRLPASHSLNLRLEWERTFENRVLKDWKCYLALWNLYGHPNPIGIDYLQELGPPDQPVSYILNSLPFFFDLGVSFSF